MHSRRFFEGVGSVAKSIDLDAIERLAQELATLAISLIIVPGLFLARTALSKVAENLRAARCP